MRIGARISGIGRARPEAVRDRIALEARRRLDERLAAGVSREALALAGEDRPGRGGTGRSPRVRKNGDAT